MKLSILSALALPLLFGAFVANAQKVEISPVPISAEWGAKAFDSDKIALKLSGNVDGASSLLLTSGNVKGYTDGKKGNVKLVVGKKGDKSIKSVTAQIPDVAEGYWLKITPSSITVAGADDSGVYYGLQTLSQILAQPEVMQVEISDYPKTALRGVIEGFYGNPWSFEDRVSQFDFYGKNKMNVYVYGPKDDPYHHSKWNEPYPAKEAENLGKLVKHAADNKVKFVWAMHPSNSIVTEDDRASALAKFNQLYDLGVRCFAVFFDDIAAESVESQIDYLNFLTDNFVKVKGDVEPLTVCPTIYNKAWASGDYLKKMGKGLYDGINIMWTGNSVVDMIQKEDTDWITGQTGRKPFIWLNYPVNDYGLHHLLMGPTVGNGSDIYDGVSAFCSNPMQYAEASKVSLYSLADFAWNPKAYDPQADWERSMEAVMPGHGEAFRQFCIDNIDLGENVHRLRYDTESPDFKTIHNKYGFMTSANAAAYEEYFKKMAHAADELMGLANNRMTAEIKEFLEYYAIQANRGLLAAKMVKELEDNNDKAFMDTFTQYAVATALAETIVSRNFEGSIQRVNAETATRYVEPFIKSTVEKAMNSYRDRNSM